MSQDDDIFVFEVNANANQKEIRAAVDKAQQTQHGRMDGSNAEDDVLFEVTSP
ncbi:MAG: hypothetical protein GF398_12410, partial [Chitinivibrionales bacterium]|nr:hypothetical protein [Chitinivibrionales bacterium]